MELTIMKRLKNVRHTRGMTTFEKIEDSLVTMR